MQESIIKGIVSPCAIDPHEIEAGTVALIKSEERYYKITVTHVDVEGDWVVTGEFEGIVDKDKSFFRLMVLSNRGSYPVAVKHWNRFPIEALVNGDKFKFKLVPYKFREGSSIQTCTDCSASFTASKSQPFCRKCCEEMSVAHLVTDTQKKKSSKPKRPRMLTQSRVKQIGIDAFNMINADPNIPIEKYSKWLDKQIEDGNNVNN